MSKLKNVIKQLSAEDYKTIHEFLMDNNAEKSAHLLKFMREKQYNDDRIMQELDVNPNAYYTLRSRLNQKIEEFLLEQMENPRTDLLKKVANITEVVFGKNRGTAITTLKVLERELIDFDLSNELTIVYKYLKKLHLNTPESFQYSQAYNRHVAYMLALDKAEDLIAEYFRKFGNYFMSGLEVEKMELSLLYRELTNVRKLYESHRLYVYHSCVSIFHRFYVDSNEVDEEDDAVEDILENVEKIFDNYYTDNIYFNLKPVFEFLKLEYYSYIKVYKKADKFFDVVNRASVQLLGNYSLFTFPAMFLETKLNKAIRSGTAADLYKENLALFDKVQLDHLDMPKLIIYNCYRSISCYYANRFEEALSWLSEIITDLMPKRHPQAWIEVKVFQCLLYTLTEEYELFNLSANSVQRFIRVNNLEATHQHSLHFIRMLRATYTERRANKRGHIASMITQLKGMTVNHFSPTMRLKTDDNLLSNLVPEDK